MTHYLGRIDDLKAFNWSRTFVSEVFLRRALPLARHDVRVTNLKGFGFCTLTYRSIMMTCDMTCTCTCTDNSTDNSDQVERELLADQAPVRPF